MTTLKSTFQFVERASFPKNAVALIYDLEGFSRFFNQPDVQNYVPAFLNHISSAISKVLFGGITDWIGTDNGKSVAPLRMQVAHEKFLGDGALYILLPQKGDLGAC